MKIKREIVRFLFERLFNSTSAIQATRTVHSYDVTCIKITATVAMLRENVSKQIFQIESRPALSPSFSAHA